MEFRDKLPNLVLSMKSQVYAYRQQLAEEAIATFRYAMLSKIIFAQYSV